MRVQGKGSCFVVLDKEDYVKKVEHQINRNSFEQLQCDPTKSFEVIINTWEKKWSQMNVLNEKWKSYI